MDRKLVVNLHCDRCGYGETKKGTPIEIIGIKKEWNRQHGKHRENIIVRFKKFLEKR